MTCLENLSILVKLEGNMERLNLKLLVILQFTRGSSEGDLCRTIGALGVRNFSELGTIPIQHYDLERSVNVYRIHN